MSSARFPFVLLGMCAAPLFTFVACVEHSALEGEPCQAGAADQQFGIVDCLPALECCFPPEGSARSVTEGGLCVAVEAPNDHDVGHAGDEQCPADLFGDGE